MALGWLKKGAAARKEFNKAEAEAKARSEESVFRFWLPMDKEARITFLDGRLGDDGTLEFSTFWEHQLNINGNWRNWFVCTATEDESQPCPICAQGDNPSLVSPFTIIDHTEYKDRKGNLHKNEIRLFMAKRNTLGLLQNIAAKRGGLTGCTFDVSRVGDNAPSVGSMFDFIEKQPLPILRKKYKVKGPLKYSEVIKYKTPEELKKMGFGTLAASSYEDVEDDDFDTDSEDYESDL